MREIKNTKEIQELTLHIFKQFNTFCVEKGINFFLAYGTLIGAIRHNGFIPWDDDIDIWMLREDFERLVTEFPSWGKTHGLYINSPETVNRTYNRIHAQICSNNTKVVATNRIDNYEEGCFIDIFPIDGSPNDAVRRWIRLPHLQIIKNLGTISAVKPDAKNKSIKHRAISWAAAVLRCLNLSRIMGKYKNLARRSSYLASEYLQLPIAGRKGRNLLLPRDYFLPSVKKSFENMDVAVPKEYDKVLKVIYGDYMVLPPEDKRVSFHECQFFISE